MTNDEDKVLSFRAKSRNLVAKPQGRFHGVLRLRPHVRGPLRMTPGRFDLRHSFVIRRPSFVISTITRFALVLLIAVTISCSSKRITKENVDEVSQGMTKKQVESILGSPSSRTVQTYIYRQGKDTVTITFKDDKVQSKNSTLSE